MSKYVISSSPHLRDQVSTRSIMQDVCIAMLPACAAGVLFFGYRSAVIIALAVAAAVLSEWFYCKAAHQKSTIGDFSAVVTGLLLGLNLSSSVPVWQCVVGSAFAIIIVKCLFGGLGHNFANPAISGRVFMLLAFSEVAGGAMPAVVELEASATPLELISAGSEQLPSLMDMFLGLRGGAVGESCILALLIGYAYLCARRVIKWYVPAAFVGTVFVLSLVSAGSFVTALYSVMAGGVFLGAIFMATDYVTTPINNTGRVVFAVGCGVITFVIREFCAYPEGVSFSILAMNILTPYIEKWTAKKPLGGV